MDVCFEISSKSKAHHNDESPGREGEGKEALENVRRSSGAR